MAIRMKKTATQVETVKDIIEQIGKKTIAQILLDRLQLKLLLKGLALRDIYCKQTYANPLIRVIAVSG